MFASEKDHLESAVAFSLNLEPISKQGKIYLIVILMLGFTGASLLNAEAMLMTVIIYAGMVGWVYARIHLVSVVKELITELKKVVEE